MKPEPPRAQDEPLTGRAPSPEPELDVQRLTDLLKETQALAKVGGWEIDLDTGRLHWTDETYRLHDTSPAEYRPTVESAIAFYAPECIPVISAAVEEAIRDGRSFDLELELITAKGRRVWARANGRPVLDQGRAVRVVGAFQDITERKRAENALRDSEYFFKESLRSAGVGSYKTDFRRGEWESSSVLDSIFGIDKAYHRSVEGWLDLVHPDDRDMMERYLKERVIAHREPFAMDYRIIRRNDGQTRWVNGFGEVQFDGDGNLLFMFGTIKDITERKEDEATIRRMNEELEQRVLERTAQLEASNRELEAFSYSVSHDLRGPLRGIDGFSGALLADYRDQLDPTALHFLERIRVGAQRMGQLIDDLLKLSRINRGGLELTEIDLSGLCLRVLDDLARAEPDRRVRVEVQPDMRVRADLRMMQVALENLLGNAWKFTSRCPEARIQVGGTEAGGARAWFVRDNGAGFEMAYVDKVFQAFQRLHSVEEFQGTGIGLAIVERIIHRHGGRVWADAEPGAGATFHFTLP